MHVYRAVQLPESHCKVSVGYDQKSHITICLRIFIVIHFVLKIR